MDTRAIKEREVLEEATSRTSAIIPTSHSVKAMEALTMEIVEDP